MRARAEDIGEQIAFVVRLKQTHTFATELSVRTSDAQGRLVLDEIGMLGRDKDAMPVRRITLIRAAGDQDDVVLLTNLMDRWMFPAAEVLDLYRLRWGIEQVFQQVTETFSLSHLIGSSPKATLLQFGYCLLLYNLIQVVRAYIAQGQQRPAESISSEKLFDDIQRHVTACDVILPRPVTLDYFAATPTATQVRARLQALLGPQWDPIWQKAAKQRIHRVTPRHILMPE